MYREIRRAVCVGIIFGGAYVRAAQIAVFYQHRYLGDTAFACKGEPDDLAIKREIVKDYFCFAVFIYRYFAAVFGDVKGFFAA